MTKKQVIVYQDTGISPRYLEATKALAEGKAPPEAIKSHPGKGGKTFDYLGHIWVGKQVRSALEYLWSFDVLEGHICNDGSAWTLCKFTTYVPFEDKFLENSITEVGCFDGGGGKMSQAMMIASAASRGLVRCVMRRFGLGEELYEADVKITVDSAWNALKEFFEPRNVIENDVITRFKGAGITKENLVERFEEAYAIVSEMAGTKKPTAKVPEDLDPVVKAAVEEMGAEVVAKHDFTGLYDHGETLGLSSSAAKEVWEKAGPARDSWRAKSDKTLKKVMELWVGVGADKGNPAEAKKQFTQGE